MTVDDEDFFSDLGYDTEKEVTFQVDDALCSKKEIKKILYKYPKYLGFVAQNSTCPKGQNNNINCSQCDQRCKQRFIRKSSRYCQDLCIDYLRSHIDDLREHFEKNKLPIESIKLTRETKGKNCTYTLEIEIEQ